MKNYIEKYFLNEVFKVFDKKTSKVVMYGSFNLKNKGDFDVAVICNHYNEFQKQQIKNILEGLHRKFNLRIDEDVPYFNKSLFSYDECEYILQRPPFAFKDYKAVINPFYGNSDYFVSLEARYRLLINLLTSKVRILHGNIKDERKKVFQLLIGIVFSALDNKRLSIDKIVQHLCIDPYSYYTYKRYLGYNPLTDAKFLRKNIKKNIKDMKRNNKVLKSGKEYFLSKEYLNIINNLRYGAYEELGQ